MKGENKKGRSKIVRRWDLVWKRIERKIEKIRERKTKKGKERERMKWITRGRSLLEWNQLEQNIKKKVKLKKVFLLKNKNNILKTFFPQKTASF